MIHVVCQNCGGLVPGSAFSSALGKIRSLKRTRVARVSAQKGLRTKRRKARAAAKRKQKRLAGLLVPTNVTTIQAYDI